MSKERTSERKKAKRQRIGFGEYRTRLQLSAEELKAFDESGYVPRWVNDVDGRVERFKAAGYEFADPEEALSVGQSEIHQGNSDLGTRVSKIVSRGGGEPVRAYLMKQRKDWYEEDQLVKEEQNAQVDRALKEGHAGGAQIENQYGSVTMTRD